MKRTLIALCCLLVAFAAGCAKEETYEAKPLTGIGAIFDESLGYYNEHPSVIELDGVRYVYYTRNAEKNTVSDTIAVRKGTFADGGGRTAEPRTLLAPSQDGWDSAHVYAPTVIKGRFRYGGKDYSYLMAYARQQRGGPHRFQSDRAGGIGAPGRNVCQAGRAVYHLRQIRLQHFAARRSSKAPASRASSALTRRQGVPVLFVPYAQRHAQHVAVLGGRLFRSRYDRAARRRPGPSGKHDGHQRPGQRAQSQIGRLAYDPGADAFYTVRDYYPAQPLRPPFRRAWQLLKADRFRRCI